MPNTFEAVFRRPFTEEDLFRLLSNHPEFSNPLVALTASTYTLDPLKHAGRTLMFDLATGVTVTLPKATGSGNRYRFRVKTLATSNSHIVKVANSTDVIQGSIWISDTDTAGTTTAFSSAASSDTITLNRSTTGSVTVGEFIEIEDIASGIFAVHGFTSNTASGATPFSATV
jgi:hypothetical protein